MGMKVVYSGGDSMYCQNEKCPFCNHQIGCAGYEEGDKPRCDLCGKRTYDKPNPNKPLGDISGVDI